MRKYILGLAVLTLATMAFFAFMPNTEKAGKELKRDGNAQTLYIWFQIPLGKGIICAGGTVQATDVTPHPKSSSNPLTDMAAFTLTQAQAESTFGCSTSDLYTCVVGYAVDASNFTASGSTWIPTTSATVQIRLCRIVR